jgi:multidrug efflux pump
LGAGAKSRVSMGIVIIGGLLFSLGLTLFIIPALYTYLSSSKIRIADSVTDSAESMDPSSK